MLAKESKSIKCIFLIEGACIQQSLPDTNLKFSLAILRLLFTDRLASLEMPMKIDKNTRGQLELLTGISLVYINSPRYILNL